MKTIFIFICLMFLSACAPPEDCKFCPFVNTAVKTEIPCPIQDTSVGVFYAFGQSNSANHAAYVFKNTDTSIVNYFNGKCYIAEDPILGATGNGGSSWIPMAKKLLTDNKYTTIVIGAGGIGAASVGEINGGIGRKLVESGIEKLSSDYEITAFLYHQGEANRSSTEAGYAAQLLDLITWVSTYQTNLKFFVSVASICESGPYVQVQNAQRSIVNGSSIVQGPDTDVGITYAMRIQNCHFNKTGQQTAGGLWADRIKAEL